MASLALADSSESMHTFLSVTEKAQDADSSKSMHTFLSAVEVRREQLGLSQEAVARAIGYSRDGYRKMVARGKTSPRIVSQLRKLMVVKAVEPDDALLLSTYYGFVVSVAGFYRVTPEQVRATAGEERRTADPVWLACSHARQAAIYLTNTALGVRQARLAAALSLTPAAVCLALKSVEDRRDDPIFNALLAQAVRNITGMDE